MISNYLHLLGEDLYLNVQIVKVLMSARMSIAQKRSMMGKALSGLLSITIPAIVAVASGLRDLIQPERSRLISMENSSWTITIAADILAQTSLKRSLKSLAIRFSN